MPEVHAYLIGNLGLSVIFVLLCLARKDLRRVMVYSGIFYLLFMTLVFICLKLLTSDPAKTITPGYWSPPSLLDLNRRTGGYGIEDVFYMFFVGAIAAGLYDLIFKFKVSKTRNKKLLKGPILSTCLIISLLIYVLTPINVVDFFVIFQFMGAASIVWLRKDLFFHSLSGGILFMILYATLFEIFKILFPAFLNNYYHLDRTSHVWVLGIPLEEYLYALTLGLMWAPIYEYEFRLKDSKLPRSGLRRVFPAAVATRR